MITETVFDLTKMDKVTQKNLNKKLEARLEKMLSLSKMKKKPAIEAPVKLQLNPGAEYLTPEKVKEGLNNFEIVDLTSRTILIPAGFPMEVNALNMLLQVVKANPSVLMIRRTDNKDVKKINHSYPAGV